jgi:hypothetical protein
MPVCPHVPPYFLALSTLEGEGTEFFDISQNTNPATQDHIAEDLNPHQTLVTVRTVATSC